MEADGDQRHKRGMRNHGMWWGGHRRKEWVWGSQAGFTDGSKAMAEGKQRGVRSTEEGLCESSGSGMAHVSLEAWLKESGWEDPEDGVRKSHYEDLGCTDGCRCGEAGCF